MDMPCCAVFYRIDCTVSCDMLLCIVKATWTAWNGWSACTLTCGGGTQSRSLGHQCLVKLGRSWYSV